MEPQWKTIPWYDGNYGTSDNNRIKNFRTWKDVTQWTNVKGYKTCYLNVDQHWNNVKRKVHRLVALARVTNPDNLPQVNHLDWDKTNNTPPNLARCTDAENRRHAVEVLWIKWWQWPGNIGDYNRGRTGELHPRSKPVNQIDKSTNLLIKTYPCAAEAARELWGCYQGITICANWITKTSHGFKRERAS